MYADVESLRRLLDLSEAIGLQGGGDTKLPLFARQLSRQWDSLAASGVIVAAIAAVFRWMPNRWIRAGLLLSAGGLFYWASSVFPVPAQTQRTPIAFVTFALAALFYLPGPAPSGWDRHWAAIRGVCIASFAAGLCMAWASANGIRNLALALLPATLFGLALVSQPRTKAAAKATSSHALDGIPLCALMVSFLCFAVFDLYGRVYRDLPIPALVAAVETGAYQGIRTAPGRARFIAALEDDLESTRCSSETVLFLDYFPAGYLLSDLRPRTAALWMFFSPTERENHHPTRTIYAQPFEDGPLPDLVIDMRVTLLDWKKPAKPPSWDPVRERLAAGRYEQVLQRPEYTILRRRGAGVAPPGGDEPSESCTR